MAKTIKNTVFKERENLINKFNFKKKKKKKKI